MGEWLEIIRIAGPWGGPAVVGAYLYVKGHIATGRELKQIETALAQERKEREAERKELRRELTFWRDIAWSNSRIADQVVGQLQPNKDRI